MVSAGRATLNEAAKIMQSIFFIQQRRKIVAKVVRASSFSSSSRFRVFMIDRGEKKSKDDFAEIFGGALTLGLVSLVSFLPIIQKYI